MKRGKPSRKLQIDRDIPKRKLRIDRDIPKKKKEAEMKQEGHHGEMMEEFSGSIENVYKEERIGRQTDRYTKQEVKETETIQEGAHNERIRITPKIKKRKRKRR